MKNHLIVAVAVTALAMSLSQRAQASDLLCQSTPCGTSQSKITFDGTVDALYVSNSGTGGNAITGYTTSDSASGVFGQNEGSTGYGVYGYSVGGDAPAGSLESSRSPEEWCVRCASERRIRLRVECGQPF
jgi:hypothetical protein